MDETENVFRKSCRNSLVFCGLVLVVTLIIGNMIPAKEEVQTVPVVKATTVTESEVIADFNILIEEAGFASKKATNGDSGLALYRQPTSRAAVSTWRRLSRYWALSATNCWSLTLVMIIA